MAPPSGRAWNVLRLPPKPLKRRSVRRAPPAYPIGLRRLKRKDASTGAVPRFVAVNRKMAQGSDESFVLVGIMGLKPSSSTAMGSAGSR